MRKKKGRTKFGDSVVSCCVVSPLVVHNGRRGSGKRDAKSDAVSLRLKRGRGGFRAGPWRKKIGLVTSVLVGRGKMELVRGR